ncbi:MAG TPA: hypothetical protein PK812_10040 [Beijerinckiaceae bacterium]|nr:hypothetical protein [Beijerinckiaceae bacterium]
MPSARFFFFSLLVVSIMGLVLPTDALASSGKAGPGSLHVVLQEATTAI